MELEADQSVEQDPARVVPADYSAIEQGNSEATLVAFAKVGSAGLPDDGLVPWEEGSCPYVTNLAQLFGLTKSHFR